MNDAPMYHAALSFSGEKRDYVSKVYDALRQHGVIVFYDEGALDKNISLIEHVYSEDYSRFAIVFQSWLYRQDYWPMREWKFIQARVNPQRIILIFFDTGEFQSAPFYDEIIATLQSSAHRAEVLDAISFVFGDFLYPKITIQDFDDRESFLEKFKDAMRKYRGLENPLQEFFNDIRQFAPHLSKDNPLCESINQKKNFILNYDYFRILIGNRNPEQLAKLIIDAIINDNPALGKVFRPYLALKFDPTDWGAETPFITLTRSIDDATKVEGLARYVRVGVRNEGHITARNCKVFLNKIEKYDGASYFDIYSDHQQLIWAVTGNNLPVDVEYGHQRFADIFATKSYNPRILPQVTTGKPLNWKTAFLERTTYRFHIYVTCENGPMASFALKVEWRGEWNNFVCSLDGA